MTKKKIIKGIILFVLYIMILVFLIRYISNNTNMINRIMNASCFDLLTGLMCSFVCIILTGLMDVTCARVYGVNISHVESVGLTYIASAINLILPLQLGSMAKAVYFKKKLNLTYSKYISIVSGTAVINIMITFIQIIFCMIIVSFRVSSGSYYTYFFIGVFLLMLLCIAAVTRKQDFILKILPFKGISTPVMEGFFELIGNRKVVMIVTVNLALSSILGGIRFLTIFRMLGFTGSILDGILYYGLYNASTIVPIIPGNIGISELFVGIMNKILGSDFNIGMATVLVNRIYYYIVAIIGALMAVLPLWIKYDKNK